MRKVVKWYLAALAVTVPTTLVGVLAMSSEAATTPVAAGVYTLASGASGKCVNVTGASTADAALLVQVACVATTTSQQWKATAQGSNFQLVNGNSAKCVDGTAAAAQATQSTCGTATGQQWSFTASTAAAGKYLVKNASTGLCLSNKDGSTAGNNPIVAEACSDISHMQWSFNYVSGPTATPTATTPAGSKTVAKDGSGQYTTVQAAVDSVPANNTSPVTIAIKAGTYREIVTLPSNKPYLTLQGLGTSASQVVIVNNRSNAGGYGTSGSATLFVQGANTTIKNLTISNDYGEGSQAVAANVNGDRSIFNNVRFLGAQDTLLVNNRRQYYYNVYVEGTVDFIFGGASAVFHNSQIYEKRSTGGPITAANTDASLTYGILFYKCTITGATNNTTQLGRPWGPAAQVLYRESSLSATIATAQPWTNMSTNTWQNARFFEYKNTGSGATTNSNRPQLSDSQAANYTPQKYLAGTDGWNPVL